MYIRNFNPNSAERLPPDYNGTAYTETEPAAPQPETPIVNSEQQRYADERLMPRRPLIPMEQRRPQPPPAARQEKSGILHNLDLLNRKFTLEDILLAALILMMIGGQNDDTDNTEMILILGFILLVGLT